jgi:hypothetical protein
MIENSMKFPWILQAQHSGQPWGKCVDGYPTSVQGHVRQLGGVLIRGLHNPSPNGFEEFVACALGNLMTYSDRATPKQVNVDLPIFKVFETPTIDALALAIQNLQYAGKDCGLNDEHQAKH